MAARPGEDLAATLFDKGSYVYLFENPGQRRARLEIANNAGTPDQDAFTGHLDSAHVKYSYKHTTLVSLTVDGPNGQQRNSPIGTQEWHLPTFDPRNETKYMYRLHTIDLYFWNKEDALNFVNGVRRVLPQHQITLEDEPVPPPPHADDMSPVVRQLENVAISDPSYQHGRTKTSRTSPPAAINVSFPGPPSSSSQQSQVPTTFAPMAYNPAAPAAPEVIQHREKTPPPEDGAGNPLVHAATSDQGQFSPPSQFHQHSGFSAPAPPPQFQRQQTFPTMSPPQQAHGQGSFSAATPPQHTSTPPNSNYFPGSIPSTTTLRSPFSPQFPPQTPSFAPPPTTSIYRPTEVEAKSKKGNGGKKGKGDAENGKGKEKGPRGRLEDNAGRLEKGVTGILKKFEKKYG
ncbi:hypothetical protein NHQ30_009245 [Ciborinia camelliae]|nr:hypothetical protein NHQ30_009245 [Ciborinia camelliae]